MRLCRRGLTQQEAARRTGLSQSTVSRWVDRADGRRLDRVDWEERTHRPRHTTRVADELEELVLRVRQRLQQGALGHFGPDAIHQELERRRQRGTLTQVPSRATIHRILVRRDAIERPRRTRRPAPPKCWYLPGVARGEVELDSFDFVEQLVIRDGPRFNVFTGVSAHGGLPGAFVRRHRTARQTVDDLVRHWRQHGLPGFAQFDNDTIFQGAHQFPDAIGRVTRLVLSLGVTPVFAPPREHGVQNAIESFNGQWRRKVWQRREWLGLRELRGGSQRYLRALIQHRCHRIEAAPPRRPFPSDWHFDLDAPLGGTIIYLRRLDEDGRADVLRHAFAISKRWAGRLVRAEVALDAGRIRFCGLSRAAPDHQPSLRTVNHRIRQRPFHR